jgi:hypothetical protein
MLKVSILAAWAELQSATTRQAYLSQVLKPYRWLLGPFWVGALRDYAGLRTDPDMGAAVSIGMDNGIARDVLLPVSFGQLVILRAAADSVSTTNELCLSY